jgi:hypothetical protein
LQFWGWNIFINESANINNKSKNKNPDGAVKVSPQKFSEAIRVGHFDYVLVTYGNRQFWEDYGYLFDKPGTPDGYYLYQVNANGLKLVKSN